MKKLKSGTIENQLESIVTVETTLTKGLPSFSIVGLANNSIQEARDRVRSALLSNNINMPSKKITTNLSPSDIPKAGTHFDLAIALNIALYDTDYFDDFFVFGELSLNGDIKNSSLIYPIILDLAQKNRIKKVIAPMEAKDTLESIPNIELYLFEKLSDVIAFFKKELEVSPTPSKSFEYDYIEVGKEKYYYIHEYKEDFLDVKGQEIAKRASLISASGMHNLLLNGSPGSGKNMISRRLKYILPPMSNNEILEKAKLDILDDKEPKFLPIRAFRSPHHSSTKSSIFGGGSKEARIGEVALANSGILFLDELPHFQKQTIEALREPMEENKLLISRVNSKIEYETSFLFIGAMNPCKCGNLLSTKNPCRCTEIEIKRYKNILSDPFLDRIDIFVEMSEVKPDDKPSISSKEMRERTFKAFIFQKNRGQSKPNSKLSPKETENICILDEKAKEMLDIAITRFGLSQRAIDRTKRVARTIADLEESELITKSHIIEAIGYRRRS